MISKILAKNDSTKKTNEQMNRQTHKYFRYFDSLKNDNEMIYIYESMIKKKKEI